MISGLLNKFLKIKIPLLVLITGQKCSLRCKDCGNFTPYLPQTLYSYESIIRDLENISCCADVETLQIQGGEALLHTELDKIIIKSKELKVKNIIIATNGTKTLNQGLVKACKLLNVSIRISDYSICRTMTELLVKQCEEEQINYSVYKFSGDGEWFNLGGKNTPRENDSDKSKAQFEKCCYSKCLTVENGILARCSRATMAHNVQNFTPNNGDLLNIRKVKDCANLKSDLIKYLNREMFMEACRYCNGDSGEKILPAIQINN